MFVPERALFCHRVVRAAGGLEREGLSARYSMMTLLGLHRYVTGGGHTPFAVRDLTIELMRNLEGLNRDTGDLGLLLWTCAEITPDRLDDLIERADVGSALDRSDHARRGSTMEMAWFLTGLAKSALADATHKRRLYGVARQTYELLKRNRGPSGYFGHLATDEGLTGRFRGRIGSFADQVYPIIALSHFGRAYGVDEAVTSAVACADAICRVQGPLGQWWWHYDAPSGKVVQRYPVYSVHQDGMGPMALFAVSRVSGKDFTGPALRSLHWINGANELRQDMRDATRRVIWRSIRFTSRARLVQREAALWFDVGLSGSVPDNLAVLYECRPYHLGWLLYAFSHHCDPNAAAS
jgi:hypothetical protein